MAWPALRLGRRAGPWAGGDLPAGGTAGRGPAIPAVPGDGSILTYFLRPWKALVRRSMNWALVMDPVANWL
jgi:hypothetical protein